jgi:DNA-binding beta-propeller fold protein YncE
VKCISTAILLSFELTGCGTPEGVPADLDGAPGGGGDIGPLGDGLATLAGTGLASFLDGPRSQARFDDPANVLVASDGRVFVADYNNGAIRVAAPDGTVRTLTRQDNFARPFGLALSPDGATLYVSTDRNDSLEQTPQTGTIWRVDLQSGAATVVASDLGRPRSIATVPDGRLVLSDNQHHTLRLLDPVSGAVSPLAGALDQPGRVDAQGAAARFDTPYDLVVDGHGDVLVADYGNHLVRKVTLAGAVTTLAGSGAIGWADGPAGEATFDHPQGLAIDAAGTLYVSDADNFCVRKLAGGVVTTVAGDRTAGFRDGEPMEAQLFGLEGIDVTRDGTMLYIADGDRGEEQPYHRVRRLAF